ncbi:MAG: hypothetical protein GFH23_1086674n94 [Chloroflexi bacterium AL-N1]|nr:hypothetical protein [Chloroflexi bacterium AL-N1]NOK92185.1 hypothetical protein [Chloroflexi bacterium AL-N15]
MAQDTTKIVLITRLSRRLVRNTALVLVQKGGCHRDVSQQRGRKHVVSAIDER